MKEVCTAAEVVSQVGCESLCPTSPEGEGKLKGLIFGPTHPMGESQVVGPASGR